MGDFYKSNENGRLFRKIAWKVLRNSLGVATSDKYLIYQFLPLPRSRTPLCIGVNGWKGGLSLLYDHLFSL